ncbi:MAG TPA: putative toxin-antitoxin system toxin component, PIN family [Anaerolineales bacterium]|nr:putative toxin-antitoxin system toxin component, PIN family [Anaerolineales bacterium]
MNVVLDTNTVISGLLWKGAPRRVLDEARAGLFTIFTSPELLAELADVLGREKFAERLALAETSVEELVYGYAALAITIRPEKIDLVIMADPEDDKVLACAKAANAEVIASGDSHLLDLKEYEGIKILTVNELLEKYL